MTKRKQGLYIYRMLKLVKGGEGKTMAKHRTFLNFAVPDELVERIDEAAAKSGLDRSKQTRALIEYALGYEHKPFIPAAQQERLSFESPTRKATARRSRKDRVAA